MNQKWRWMLWGIGGAVAIALLVTPRIAQPQSYHLFADQRIYFGTPHFFDVVSNLGFLLVGVWGIAFVMKAGSRADGIFFDPGERWAYFYFFLGVLLTAFGSAYYHWAPDNARLLWDRLPMAMGFMGLLAAVLSERIDPSLARVALAPLLAAGIGSVLYWRWTDLLGRDDLRLYGIVQFGSLALVLALCVSRPSRYTRGADMFVVVALYILAKLFEGLDRPIFGTGRILSGHTLKHLAAAWACYFVLRMLKLRQTRLAEPHPTANATA
jgi:hypothetical protein